MASIVPHGAAGVPARQLMARCCNPSILSENPLTAFASPLAIFVVRLAGDKLIQRNGE